MSDCKYLIVVRDGFVTTIQINRPKQLNALNMALMEELARTFEELDADDSVRSIVLTGNERAFAAGADIMEMAGADSTTMLMRDQFVKWDRIRKVKKPVIAAVSGFCLGGGCELAMHCDMIIASETAQFGQPEIKIGVMPGAGGTQRLTRAIGKQRAMEMVLSGRFISAKEACDFGLVNHVVPVEVYLSEAQKLAAEIAQMPHVAVRLAKEAILKVNESFLVDGLEFERKNFYLLFNTEDQKAGMSAFLEKRKAEFKGR